MPHPLGCKGAGFGLDVAAMTYTRNPLKRHYGKNDLHFVTFSCYRRRPYLGSVRARNCFVKVLDEVRRRYGFALVGYVLMPEHVHLLISEPERGNPSRVLQVLKQRVSRALRRRKKGKKKQLEFRFDGEVEAPAFWQRRFYDFNVWGEKKLQEKLNYMYANPVVRGLVKHPKDWPWSSWSFYEKGAKGMIEIELTGMRRTPGEKQSQKPHPYNSKGAAPSVTSEI